MLIELEVQGDGLCVLRTIALLNLLPGPSPTEADLPAESRYHHHEQVDQGLFCLKTCLVMTRPPPLEGPRFLSSEPSGGLAFQGTERVGFEPTNPCGSPVFKTGAINHSTTSPDGRLPPPRHGRSCRLHSHIAPGRGCRDRPDDLHPGLSGLGRAAGSGRFWSLDEPGNSWLGIGVMVELGPSCVPWRSFPPTCWPIRRACLPT